MIVLSDKALNFFEQKLVVQASVVSVFIGRRSIRLGLTKSLSRRRGSTCVDALHVRQLASCWFCYLSALTELPLSLR